MRRWGVAIALVVLSACPKRDAGPNAFDLAIQRADAAWERRLEDGVQPVQDALDEAFLIRRQDPRVRWRLARLEVTLGMLAEDSVHAQAAYARARGHGWACLDTVAGVAELRRSGGWQEALSRVPVYLDPCVSWTGFAWARWRQAAGLSGAIDDAAIRSYVHAMPADDGGLSLWSVAISDSLYDQASASASFAEAIRHDPDDVVRRIDRLMWVRAVEDPTALQLQGRRLLDRTADTLEEQGAIARLRRAMR